ncbi:hypothetical protein F5Y15DRAFT_428909 [Xylariaceae sp. FL0016]|nr:hypothetical protein F5Y15DRAFT_428909 [Xylariaceae sp. FL0016]
MMNNTRNLASPDSSIDRVLLTPSTDLPHDDVGAQVNVCIWSLAILAAGWLVLRIYCKYIRHRGLWWDDYLLIASWVSLALANVSSSYSISIGFGHQIYDIEPHNVPVIILAAYISGLFSVTATALSKTSFAVTLLRISGGWIKSTVWFIIVTINIFMFLSIVFNWAQCTPVEKNFHPFIAGQCWSRSLIISYNIFTAAYSGVMDIILALLPWKIVWQLNMNKKERIGAICAMSLGIFAGLTSLVKTIVIPGPSTADIDRSIQLLVLAVAEVAITIMAASIPILRALARDKTPAAGGGGLFARNATQRRTQTHRRQSSITLLTPTEESELADAWPMRSVRKLEEGRRKNAGAAKKQPPPLSQIMEEEDDDEDEVETTWARQGVERSFV